MRKANSKYTPRIPVAPPSRKRLLERIRMLLERRGYPRLQMMLLVALTGGAGFLCSFALLSSGVHAMWLRYAISVSAAYLGFLLLLWLWLRTGAEDYADLNADLLELIPEGGREDEPAYEGGGGEFGGGAASGRFDDLLVESPASGASDGVSSAADAAGSVDDLAAIPLLVLVFVLGLLVASISVVYSAPLLFAELLLDGVLAATLYRRLKKLERRHWLQTAVRRTWLPFLVTAVVLALAGWGMSIYAPDALSIGDVIALWRESRTG